MHGIGYRSHERGIDRCCRASRKERTLKIRCTVCPIQPFGRSWGLKAVAVWTPKPEKKILSNLRVDQESYGTVRSTHLKREIQEILPQKDTLMKQSNTSQSLSNGCSVGTLASTLLEIIMVFVGLRLCFIFLPWEITIKTPFVEYLCFFPATKRQQI